MAPIIRNLRPCRTEYGKLNSRAVFPRAIPFTGVVAQLLVKSNTRTLGYNVTLEVFMISQVVD